MKSSNIFISRCSIVAVSGAVQGHCPDGWTNFAESCYLFGHEQLDFDDAEAFCGRFQGHLVNIESAEENAFIRAVVRTLKAPKHWIGLTDQVLEDIWKLYPSETTAEFLDWGSGEPNGDLKANCGAIWESFDYHWVDELCSNRFNPICETAMEAETIVG